MRAKRDMPQIEWALEVLPEFKARFATVLRPAQVVSLSAPFVPGAARYVAPLAGNPITNLSTWF
jgi:hypothetical protein